jgi:hypothetical protein
LKLVLGLTSLSDEVKEHWNNHDFAVQEMNALGNVFRPPLLIRYIDEGSIIIPGMSGMSILDSNPQIIVDCNNWQIHMLISLSMVPVG